MSEVVERFLKYIKIDTESARESDTFPSTMKQLDLARLLRDELIELGLEDVTLDEYGYVMATLPANIQTDAPVVGFLGHMDTSPDFSGKDVNPQFIENYDGNTIVLNREQNIVLSPELFPALKKYIGKTLITTDGTTLLGADDKAGVAQVMAAMSYLIQHPEISHGTIKVGFTPDEEVGHGVDHFDVARFGADFAYTLDGGEVGQLQHDNFNAASARVVVKGANVHPGEAKDKMVNAVLIAMEYNDLLPVQQRPEFTQKYEGFFHIYSINGTVEKTTADYIVRDHDRARFDAKKVMMTQAANFINAKYGQGTVQVLIEDQYYNMKEMIEPHPEIISAARTAMEELGITPIFEPIRGGTDGSRLSYMGLPTPNLFTGGHYAHGKFEFLPVFALEKGVEVIVKIAEVLAR